MFFFLGLSFFFEDLHPNQKDLQGTPPDPPRAKTEKNSRDMRLNL